MFVTAQDFDKIPYFIPRIETNNSFPDFIEEKEKEILRKVLGSSFYADLIAGLAIDPPDPKWTDIRDGASYTVFGKGYKYRGLKPLLIPYIYSEWLTHTWDTHTDNGIVMAAAENSQVLSPSRRIANAFNQFSFQVGFDGDIKDTLFGFLDANKAIYPTLEFNEPGTKNVFNI